MKTKQTILVSLLTLVLTLSLVLVAFVGCNYSQDEALEEENSNFNGGMVMNEEVVGNGIMLLSTPIPTELYDDYGISPIAETAKQLTATITPDNASTQGVTWSVYWKDASSAWAKGKAVSDYVRIQSASQLTANIECLQAFGEKVIVSASTIDGTNLSATCECNYIKRVSKVDLKIPKSAMADDNRGFDTATSSQPYYVKLYANISSTGSGSLTTTVTYGEGTIQEDITVKVTCYLSDSFYSILSSKGYTISSDQRYSEVITTFVNSSGACTKMFGSNFATDVPYANAVINSLSAGGNCLKFKVTAVGEHSNYSVEYSAFVDTSAMRILATGVAIDLPDLNF